MVYMTSASRYVTSASCYQSRSSVHIRGMIPRRSMELAEAVPIGEVQCHWGHRSKETNLHSIYPEWEHSRYGRLHTLSWGGTPVPYDMESPQGPGPEVKKNFFHTKLN